MKVTISERAAAQAHALLEARSAGPEAALRIFVAGNEYLGYRYGLAVAAGAQEGDTVLETTGVRVVLDEESAVLLDGAEIDWLEGPDRRGFTIFSPRTLHTCGDRRMAG